MIMVYTCNTIFVILLIFWLIDWFQIWAPKQHCPNSFPLQTLKTSIQLFCEYLFTIPLVRDVIQYDMSFS